MPSFYANWKNTAGIESRGHGRSRKIDKKSKKTHMNTNPVGFLSVGENCIDDSHETIFMASASHLIMRCSRQLLLVSSAGAAARKPKAASSVIVLPVRIPAKKL